MEEKIYDLTDSRLHYEELTDSVTITAFEGLCGEVEIPERIAGKPVWEIAKKAFLSHKNLKRVILPESIRVIGDWAFAHCDRLERVTLPAKAIHFGKAVFLECNGLKRLEIAEREKGIAELLAAAVTLADAPYLLDTMEAGSGEWLAKWDARLLAILNSDDTEGYSKQVLCGEEDYGSTDLNAYMAGRRKHKIRLSLLRMLYSSGLNENMRTELTVYLQNHAKGCPTEETWQVVLQEYGDDPDYYKLLTELGCVSEENVAAMLDDMGEGHPEMKAFLLKFQSEQLTQDHFFGSLEL